MLDVLVSAVAVFVVTVIVIELFLYAYRTVRHPDRPRIRRRLKTLPSRKRETASLNSDIVRKRVFSDVPWLNRLLLRMTAIERLDRLKHQANARYPVSFYLLLALVLAATGFLVSSQMMENRIASAGIALLLGAVPFIYLINKKIKRMRKFQAQLPEALDMIARSMKAGHAFSTGMRLAADEFGDPLGPELAYTLDEINFGVRVHDALKNLARRVDCQDMNFFVVSVILQRETGGNLAEIIESIAHLIRERFKLLDRIRTLSAEGKLSAVILALIPFIVAGVLYFRNRQYITVLVSDPVGKMMIAVAAVLMIVGIYMMKRIINIKV